MKNVTPILIVIPFWEADKPAAMDLCRIITGLQPHHVGDIADVLLVARQDCHHDKNMVNIVASKFTVYTHVTNSPMRGWPNGSNGMFGSTIMHISNTSKHKYECLYWMEPDAIPLCPNWFADILQAWRNRRPGSLIVGCRARVDGNDPSSDHITGCALYHPNIARLMPYLSSASGEAWDWKHRARIVQNGDHTPMIENWYHANNADPGIIDRDKVGVRIIHGFKDRSMVELVSRKYNISLV